MSTLNEFPLIGGACDGKRVLLPEAGGRIELSNDYGTVIPREPVTPYEMGEIPNATLCAPSSIYRPLKIYNPAREISVIYVASTLSDAQAVEIHNKRTKQK